MTPAAGRDLEGPKAGHEVGGEGPRLRLSAAARAAALRDLAHDEALRIAFAGGCGALGFRLSRSRRAYEGDRRLEIDGVPVLLDARAGVELDGAVLDHDEDDGFRLDHPRWGQSC